MRYIRFQIGNGPASYGVLRGDQVRRLDGDIFHGYRETFEENELQSVHLLAPVNPGKIIGIGANYKSFLDAKKREYPKRPRIFLKPASSIIGDRDAIICPDKSHEIHFEGELGVIIGKTCSQISEENAMSNVFGYTCVNDVTDRTMLEEDGIWDRGKGVNTFFPIGPCITDEIDGMNVELETRVNGEVRQHRNTSDMYFSISQLIAYISNYMTLNPGDVIATGTPVGTGCLNILDTVEVEIKGIGTLRNQMIERIAHED